MELVGLVLLGVIALSSALTHPRPRFVIDVSGAAPNTSTTGPQPQWFNQKLDHFDVADTRMWRQKYYVNDQFYKPGGPAFLHIGAEGPLEQREAVAMAYLEYAKVYHAIGFAVEHRYYGDSRPTPDLSTANLKYLTIENALEDLAAFIRVTGTQRNITKWITFGGSYAGMLSAYMRYKFPHLVIGAVAHSAPLGLTALVPKFAYGLGQSLHTIPGCYKAVEAAFKAANVKLQTDAGATELGNLFNICPYDRHNHFDVGNVNFALIGSLLFTIQVSDVHFQPDPKQFFTITSLCQVMTTTSIGTPLERLAYYSNPLLTLASPRPTAPPCDNETTAFYYFYRNNLDFDNNLSTGTGRQWNYQECTQLGGFLTTNIAGSPFGDLFDEAYYSQYCEIYFGQGFNSSRFNLGNAELHMNYGGLSLHETNVVFTQGEYDPYRQYGFARSPNSGAHVIIMRGVGHAADMYASTSLDKPDLRKARRSIRHFIGQWLSHAPATIFG